MCNIFNYYYNISGAPKKNLKNNKNKKFGSTDINNNNNNNNLCFKTLDDVANYRINVEQKNIDCKILRYHIYGVGLCARMHVFIPSAGQDSLYAGQDWLPYAALSTHFFAPSKITNPWANTHNTIRINYIGFYCLHNLFIQKHKNCYSNFVEKFTKKNIKKSWYSLTTNSKKKAIDGFLNHLMRNLSFCTHCNISLVGTDSVNILDNFRIQNDPNNRILLYNANFKNQEGIFTSLLNNTYFSAGLGAGFCYKLPDILRYFYNVLNYPFFFIENFFKKQKNNTTQRDFVNAIQTFFSNLALREICFLCGTEFSGSFRPYFVFNHTVYEGNTSCKDTFFSFYYGIQFRFNRILARFRWALGFLNLTHFIIKSLNNTPELEKKVPIPRISQGATEFTNTVVAMDATIYLLYNVNTQQC